MVCAHKRQSYCLNCVGKRKALLQNHDFLNGKSALVKVAGRLCYNRQDYKLPFHFEIYSYEQLFSNEENFEGMLTNISLLICW